MQYRQLVIATATVLFFLAAAAAQGAARDSDDVYVSLSILGSFPRDTDGPLHATSDRATLHNSGGGGLKAGFFLKPTRHVIGFELEYYGHGLSAGFQSGHADMIILNTMFNVLVRYPEAYLQPYIGVGVGYSKGVLTDSEVPGRSNRVESALAVGYQFLGGLRANLSHRIYLFGEYKYFQSTYHWNGLALDLREHIIATGVGLRF